MAKVQNMRAKIDLNKLQKVIMKNNVDLSKSHIFDEKFQKKK